MLADLIVHGSTTLALVSKKDRGPVGPGCDPMAMGQGQQAADRPPRRPEELNQ